MIDFLSILPPEPRPPAEIPPNEPVIPDSEDPSRPSLPEELPQPDADPSPNSNPPLEMRSLTANNNAPEIGGRHNNTSAGLSPTRFNDWEMNGKCVDF